MKSVQNDMTVGSPMKMILSFTFPIFLGNVFQQFYNMADAVIVGKFVGTKALAAVGSTGTIMFLIYGFVVGMTAGFTVLTAQKFGAGDMQGMRRTVAGAGILSLLIGLFLTVTFMLFMKPLLHLMHTPSDIFADAYKYIMIVSGGILAQMLYNLLSSILRALGNSKIPLYFLIISALLNIVLDLVLIIVFQMGAPGAAIATVVAQGISGVLCLIYIMWKIPLLHLKKEDWHVGGQICAIQLKIGLPMALQGCDTGICSDGNNNGNLRSTEYRSRKCTEDPSGVQGLHNSWHRLRSCSSNIYHDSRKIHDLSVCLRGCGYYHEFCGYLSEMYRTFLHSACNCEYLQKWNPGTRIRTAADDGRCC